MISVTKCRLGSLMYSTFTYKVTPAETTVLTGEPSLPLTDAGTTKV